MEQCDRLSPVRLVVMKHPSEQVNLGDNGHRLHCATRLPLGHNRRAVPLKKAVQNTEWGVHGDLDELTAFGLVAWRSVGDSQIARISHYLGDLREVKHDIGHRALSIGATMCQATEDIAQRHKTHELPAGGRKDGQLVETPIAHNLDRRFTGEVGGHSGDRLQPESANLCTSQGISRNRGLLCLSSLGGG